MSTLGECFHCVKEVVFSFFIPVYDSLTRVLRELSVFYYELVQVVPQEISTCITTMTIKDSEETAFWPVFHVFFGWWLHDIEDNADSIFVVVSNDSLIGISCIAHNKSVFSNTALGGLPTR